MAFKAHGFLLDISRQPYKFDHYVGHGVLPSVGTALCLCVLLLPTDTHKNTHALQGELRHEKSSPTHDNCIHVGLASPIRAGTSARGSRDVDISFHIWQMPHGSSPPIFQGRDRGRTKIIHYWS